MRAWLCACLIAWVPLAQAVQTGAEQTAALASEIKRDAGNWSPEQYSERVDEYGKLVSAAREDHAGTAALTTCLLYTSPSPRD